eukprot:jgi/Chlat1/4005/Chrsp26S03986
MNLGVVKKKMVARFTKGAAKAFLPGILSRDAPPARSFPDWVQHEMEHRPTKSREELLVCVPAEYYNEDYDPTTQTLEKVPFDGWNEQYLDDRVRENLQVLDAVNSELSARVMANYNEFVQGLGLVSQVERDLQRIQIVCKNGRRYLTQAEEEISRNLSITENIQKKQVLLNILEVIAKIKALCELKATVKQTIEDGKYAKAVRMCMECVASVDGFAVTAVQNLVASLEDLVHEAVAKAGVALYGLCAQFESHAYMKVVDVYVTIGDHIGLAEKVQTCFQQRIVQDTHDVLRAFALQNADPSKLADPKSEAYKKSRYSCSTTMICAAICLETSSVPVWPKLMRQVLFELLKSYDAMTKYHESRVLAPNTNGCLPHDVTTPNVNHVSNLVVATKPKEAMAHEVQETCNAVLASLTRGRKAIWELAARRIGVLLSADAMGGTTGAHFLQIMDWTNKFIRVGEAFSGTEVPGLRTKLARQSLVYFEAYHRQNIEVLRMVLDNELWQRLPPGSLKIHKSVQERRAALSQRRSLQDTLAQDAAFDIWLNVGNPFAEAKWKTEGVGSPEANGVQTQPNFSMDDEEDDAELLEDITYPKEGTENGNAKDGRSDGPALTSAALSALRYTDRYMRLMQKLPPVAAEIFAGICQLFDFYFYAAFNTFGFMEALTAPENQQQQSYTGALLTPRLKSTLQRIASTLNPTGMPPGGSMGSSTGSLFGAAFQDGTHVDNGLPLHRLVNKVVHPGNLFGIKERCVAAESLVCLAQQLKRHRAELQATLPTQIAQTAMEQYFSRTVDAVEDLKEHMFKVVARRLVSFDANIERIASVKFEPKELGMEHSAYINAMLSDFSQLGAKTSSAGLSSDILQLLWDYATHAAAKVLVEGYSRVKKCNNEGRALMSLDLQVLINGLQKMRPGKTKPNMQLVDSYIKAYYLPDTELLHWARIHPEYTQAQVIALVNLVANTNNWKRKTRVELVEKIESGDLER